MKLKHNKKRNTAFLYEVLIRNLAKATIRKDHDLKKGIVAVIKEHFTAGSELKKELDLYSSLSSGDTLHPFIAEKIVFEAKRAHESLDQEKIFEQQSKVINKVNKLVSRGAFNIFVPSYKSLASIYQIFDKSTSLKTKVILEGTIIKNLIGGNEKKQQEMPPVDNLVFTSFVKKFNSAYSDDLLQEQRALLNRYIVSFTDNACDLKMYLNEEVKRLRGEIDLLVEKEEILADTQVLSKLQKVRNIIAEYKNATIDADFIKQVLMIQKMVKEA